MDLATEVGKRIRDFRKAREITQEELGFRTGLTQSQIYKIENGRRRFNSEQLEKISEALDVPVVKFFEGEMTIDTDISNQKLLLIITQLHTSKRQLAVKILEYLHNVDDDVSFESLQKAIELINTVKKR